MLNKKEREEIVKKAILELKEGINSKNKEQIDNSFSFTHNPDFSWIDLDEYYSEWINLEKDAFLIMYNEY